MRYCAKCCFLGAHQRLQISLKTISFIVISWLVAWPHGVRSHALASKRNSCYNRIMIGEHIHTLFVVGNGFDIHHDINSRYSDYRNWLVAKSELSQDEDIERFFNSDCELWSSLEENLSTFDCKGFATEIVSDNPPQLGSEQNAANLR